MIFSTTFRCFHYTSGLPSLLFSDYYAAPQAAYYAIPNGEIFRDNY